MGWKQVIRDMNIFQANLTYTYIRLIVPAVVLGLEVRCRRPQTRSLPQKRLWFVNPFIGCWRSCTAVKARGEMEKRLIMNYCVRQGRGKRIATLLLWYFSQDSGLTLLKTHCGERRANGGAARPYDNRRISTRWPPPNPRPRAACVPRCPKGGCVRTSSF